MAGFTIWNINQSGRVVLRHEYNSPCRELESARSLPRDLQMNTIAIAFFRFYMKKTAVSILFRSRQCGPTRGAHTVKTRALHQHLTSYHFIAVVQTTDAIVVSHLSSGIRQFRHVICHLVDG